MEQLHMQMQSFLFQCLLFIHVYVLYIQSVIVIVPYPLGIYIVSAWYHSFRYTVCFRHTGVPSTGKSFELSNKCPVLGDPTFRQLFSNNQLLCGTFHVRLKWSEAFRSLNREQCVKMLPRIAPLISQQLRRYLM